MIIGGAIELDPGAVVAILLVVGLVLLFVLAVAGWLSWCIGRRRAAWPLGSLAFAVAAISSRTVFRLDGRDAPVVGLTASVLVGLAFRAADAADDAARDRVGFTAVGAVAALLLVLVLDLGPGYR